MDVTEAPSGEFERGQPQGRLRGTFQEIAGSRVWKVNPIGAFGAAWSDSGLHSETFWLGWSAVAQYAWSPGRTAVQRMPLPPSSADTDRLSPFMPCLDAV